MKHSDPVSRHVREIERCKQRGGRFLSIVDLLDAGTVDLDVAATLAASVLQGNSFFVGALPGGAGKTTVMGALLNFVPPGCTLRAATAGVPAEGLKMKPRHADDGPETCFICHEIGRGPYFAYLWGQDVQDFFRLPAAHHMAATNLHADTMDQAQEIICSGCGVDASLFFSWPLFVFLELEGDMFNPKRTVSEVWEKGGRLLWKSASGTWKRINEPQTIDGDLCKDVRGLLVDAAGRNMRSIEEVRRDVVKRFG